MIKKLGVIILVVALTSFLPVSAHEGVQHSTRAEETEHARDVATNARKNTICERAQTRLSKQIEQSSGIKKRYLARYQKLIDRLDNLFLRLEVDESSADATDISNDIVALNNYIKDFETDFATYVAAMRAAVNMQCPIDGNTDEIRAAVAIIRTAQTAVREDAITIRDYVAKDVVNHMKVLRDELTSNTKTDETEEEPSL